MISIDDLGAITLIVGKNCSGKTAVFTKFLESTQELPSPSFDASDLLAVQMAVKDILDLETIPYKLESCSQMHVYTILVDIMTSGQTILGYENIESGLHPSSQTRLIQMMMVLLRTRKKRVVIVTNSPYVIDAVAPEDVLLVEDGKATRLIDVSGAKPALKYLTVGEFWASLFMV